MKNIASFLLLGLISLTVHAQKTIEKNIPYNNQTLVVDLKFASEIEVKTWDKATIYFKADIKTKDGKFLDFYELDVLENSSSVNIVSNAKPIFKKIWDEYEKNHPGETKRYFSTEDEYEFNYVLYVPKNARFKISSINGHLKSELIEGNFTAELINGDIDIAKYAGDLDLSTINGAIDLKMIHADLVAETIHGDIYADEKLDIVSSDRHVGQKVRGRFDSATNHLRLNTINGNMYLRL